LDFYDSENFPFRADVAADYSQIVQDGFERNLRPNRPAFEMDGLGHRHLECQTPYRVARMKFGPTALNSAFR